MKEYKLVLSNLSMGHKKARNYQLSIDLDLRVNNIITLQIINIIDPKFDKSYARLIDSYILLKDLHNANKTFYLVKFFLTNKLKQNFTDDVVRKYSDIIDVLTQKNNEYNEVFKNKIKLFQEAKKASKANKSNDTNSKVESKKDEKEIKKKKEKSEGILPKWVHWLFSGVLLFGSSFGFYYLMKNKGRFSVK